MEKIKKQYPLNTHIDWAYGISISYIREDLDRLEELGATHIDISIDYSYGDSSIEMEAKIERFETDEEFEIRKNEIKKREQKKKEIELAQYKKLKLKFEKK